MKDFVLSAIPGVWIPELGYERYFDVLGLFDGDCNLGAYIYVETLCGIPFNVEVFFPVLTSVLMAYEYQGTLDRVDVDTIGISDLIRTRYLRVEFSGESDPSDYMGLEIHHSIEELFFDEDGKFSLPTAMTALLKDLITWRAQNLDAWEEAVESCVPLVALLLSPTGQREVYSRGHLRRRRRHSLSYPPFSHAKPRGLVEMDKWIDDNGFLLNAPTYEEIKEGEKNSVKLEHVTWNWGGGTAS